MPQRILNGQVKFDHVVYEKDEVVDFPQEILDALPEGTCRELPPPPKVVTRAPRAKAAPVVVAPQTPPPAPATPTATTETQEPEAGTEPAPASTSEAPASEQEPAAPVTTG